MKKMIRRVSLTLMLSLFLAAVIQLSVHADGLSAYVKGNEVTKRIKVREGDRFRLTLKYEEQEVPPLEAGFRSSKKAVAAVTKKGMVKAKKAGKATITVTYRKSRLKLKITVKAAEAQDTENTGTGSDTEESTALPEASADAGEMTCSSGEKINSGEYVTLNLDKKARKHDWTWTFTGTCGKDARILKGNYKETGNLSFTVWPSGGTLTVTGRDPSGLTISLNLRVRQNDKWKRREKFRTDALAGITPEMTQKDMVVYFADYIADHAKYGPGQGNFFRVIDEGEGDCWGYSTAFKLLADAVGIETILVKNSLSTSHYWNQVCLDGVWYNVDAQGYDTGKAHHWILSSDKKHGSRWLGDPGYSAQYSIYYPVSPAHSCTRSLKF